MKIILNLNFEIDISHGESAGNVADGEKDAEWTVR